MRIPLVTARTAPTISEMRNSLKITRKISRKWIWERAIPRMIRVELCEPQFPPVSISIGMNETRRGIAANAFSYFVMIVPVMIEVNIRMSSQGILFFACVKTEVSK